jgi:hypothetical protein
MSSADLFRPAQVFPIDSLRKLSFPHGLQVDLYAMGWIRVVAQSQFLPRRHSIERTVRHYYLSHLFGYDWCSFLGFGGL